MQEAATMARIAAELYRLVDSQAQQVGALRLQKSIRKEKAEAFWHHFDEKSCTGLRLCCCCLGWVQAALKLLSQPKLHQQAQMPM